MTGAGTGKHGRDDAASGPASGPASESAGAARPALRRLDSAGLLAGAREIEIDHRGELYRLRCTNKGKLILTK